jgi:GntR family transcriptional regulator
MEFFVEKHSSTPVIKQIEEQIKFAVMMGIFRNGDTLPSVRDIQKQTGIHYSQIHKAYLSLRRSGLLVLTRGKGSVVSTTTDSPRPINEKCNRLSHKIASRARQLGLSPTAFARYLSRYAQQNEREFPFIVYVDDHEEITLRTAAEISELWHVPVKGIIFRELKAVIRGSASMQKILVNHIMYDHTCALIPKKKSAIIPVKVRASEQTIKLLGGIRANSSVLLIHQPHPSHRVHYMIAQFQKLVKSPGVKISSISARKVSSFKELLDSGRYDYYLVGPAVRGEVPHELRQDPHILQINPQLDPASLEAARIRAGVVI